MNEAVPSSLLPRLDGAALAALPAPVLRPAYERARTRVGIVHFGPGAFHRAHQAAFIDDLLPRAPHWAICAVALRSSDVREALLPQEGLYTLAVLQETPQLRVIGAIRELLCAHDQGAAVLARLADPDVHLLTLTITEKGYCLAGDALDTAHPDIAHDLRHVDAPRSAIGHIVAGLGARRSRGIVPFTVLSCDNLADNGGRLRRAVLEFAERVDVTLARWIEREVAFPRSMVDSITPASDQALRARVARELGCVDAWPVQREAYAQWVIEDRFTGPRPALETVGVQFSDDVAGHDLAKLRLLNGAHSTLAYVGSLLDLETVADAMQHPRLARFVERLMREDIAATLKPPAGFDAQRYVDAILARFRNPALQHRLAQIAWDGSQKLPVRIVGSLIDAFRAGHRIDRLCVPIAAWMQFVRRQARRGEALVDPHAVRLAQLGRDDADAAGVGVNAFLAVDPGFLPLLRETQMLSALGRVHAAIAQDPAQFDLI